MHTQCRDTTVLEHGCLRASRRGNMETWKHWKYFMEEVGFENGSQSVRNLIADGGIKLGMCSRKLTVDGEEGRAG